MDKIQIPRATYRLQFSPQFRFRDALHILPYLDKLGISHIYASPVTRPRTGSLHGYDVCDPWELNPELGTNDDFRELLLEVKWRKIGWIQDIVPNHMAFSHENPFLVDVMESGAKSRYAYFFDINWQHQRESLHGKLLIPLLGKHYSECLSDGELKITFEKSGLWVAYYDHRFPLSPESYWTVLGEEDNLLPLFLDKNSKDYKLLFNVIKSFENFSKVSPISERDSIVTFLKSRLKKLCKANPKIQAHIISRLNLFTSGRPEPNIRFNRLMELQNFKLALWNTSAEELNYRRFFAINDLISIRVELELVFEETHAFILNFIEKGLISGLRIDHIDGLYDPEAYLKRLRHHAPHAYIVVEKILGRTEKLPQDWPVQGTSGYEFLNCVNNIFCDSSSEKPMTSFYEKFTGENRLPGVLETSNKRLIIDSLMGGDIDNLATLILEIPDLTGLGKEITFTGLRQALADVMTHFSVYRTYISQNAFSNHDLACISEAVRLSRIANPEMEFEFRFLEQFLTLKGNTARQSPLSDQWINAVMKFQQFTGALMAKGIEDTMFYVYNRHIALNEVGGWPAHFGVSLKEFHEIMYERSLTLPYSLNATSTHDTKRGEDSRARLQILTEIPEEWAEKVSSWAALNEKYSTIIGYDVYPGRNEEYLFYQALTGSFPMDGILTVEYMQRIKDYMIKAIREAKVNTTWEKPDVGYENAFLQFIENTLDQANNSAFMTDFRRFVEKVSWFGMLNSLSQTVLKMTLPGVPDFYRGAEHWDLSLVDPDNRRPADFKMLQNRFESVNTEEVDFRQLLTSMSDGRLKMFLIRKCLGMRKENSSLFEKGNYTPLSVHGIQSQNIIAFQRNYGNKSLIVIVPRFFSRLSSLHEIPSGAIWQDTYIEFPTSLIDFTGENIFTGEQVLFQKKCLIAKALNKYPFAVFLTETLKESNK